MAGIGQDHWDQHSGAYEEKQLRGRRRVGCFNCGDNQSDQVNVAKFPHSRAVTWMWPKRLAIPNTGHVKTTFSAAVSVREANAAPA
jgi:hypothetical protein